MPKRRERAAIYVRQSDISLAMDSTTIESAIKALLDHAAKEGYEVSPEHIFKEAISGFHVYYFDRAELMKMLKGAERHEFDVLLVTEIRALSRRGAGEVLVIYNSLQKAKVRLETLNEKITDDPMGEVLLTFQASWARIEREQSFLRMQRGKKDRMEIGKAQSNGTRCYGFILVDTDKEAKGRYEFNHAIVCTDSTGTQWSEIKVRKYILDCLTKRHTLRGISMRLNELGIPPPKKAIKGKPCWVPSTIRRIAEQSINTGEVYANQYRRVGKRLVKRPKEEWVRLPDAPALIDKETHLMILHNMTLNQQEALRNNHHPEELGLLRGGYIFCGICQQRMRVKYPSSNATRGGNKTPYYRCLQKQGKGLDIIHNHRTQIRVTSLDEEVKKKIIETLLQPEVVREKVAAIRKKNTPVVDEEEIAATLASIQQKMQNLYILAENAPDDEELARLALRMQELGKQKRETEALRFALEDYEEERAEIERLLQRFEAWVAKVRPFLTDPEYVKKASYEELRLAVRVLGIRVTVYPTIGEWPFRSQIDVTVPEILASLVEQPSG